MNSSIREWARKVYLRAGLPRKCCVCGYDKHIHISHIRSVASFPDDALIEEINALDNLVALCPNHHWEYDNNILEAPWVSAVVALVGRCA